VAAGGSSGGVRGEGQVAGRTGGEVGWQRTWNWRQQTGCGASASAQSSHCQPLASTLAAAAAGHGAGADAGRRRKLSILALPDSRSSGCVYSQPAAALRLVRAMTSWGSTPPCKATKRKCGAQVRLARRAQNCCSLSFILPHRPTHPLLPCLLDPHKAATAHCSCLTTTLRLSNFFQHPSPALPTSTQPLEAPSPPPRALANPSDDPPPCLPPTPPPSWPCWRCCWPALPALPPRAIGEPDVSPLQAASAAAAAGARQSDRQSDRQRLQPCRAVMGGEVVSEQRSDLAVPPCLPCAAPCPVPCPPPAPSCSRRCRARFVALAHRSLQVPLSMASTAGASTRERAG
jgi:hypothetical protein